MIHSIFVSLAFLLSTLAFTGLSSSLTATTEESGNPWWIWVFVFLAFVAFVVVFMWWWMRSHDEDEEQAASTAVPDAAPEPVAAVQPGEAKEAADDKARDSTVSMAEAETVAVAEVAEIEDVEETSTVPDAEPEQVDVPEVQEIAETVIEADIVEEVIPEPPAPITPQQPDNLKRIEGIGPKISSVLQAAGVTTFAQLADTDADQIRQILEDENPNLVRLADPTSWPAQASLAADGNWEGLEQFQGDLHGGRHR